MALTSWATTAAASFTRAPALTSRSAAVRLIAVSRAEEPAPSSQ